jgi:ribosomal protein S18 acetylase RimI-like enzyme
MVKMKTHFRRYENENDYWRLREFLRQVFLLNDRRERSWHVARLDYARIQGCMNTKLSMQDCLFFWEVDNQIIAMMMAEGGFGNAHISVHPNLRTLELEEEMLTIAEGYLAEVKPDGLSTLQVWAPDKDEIRQGILIRRGYQKDEWPEHQWRRMLNSPIPEIPAPNGYTLRSLGDGLELLERCYASGLGFHQGDINIAVENRNDPTWYHNLQNAPLYRRDLDLVAVAADGSIASFCTIWFDDSTRSAYFEPVATVPAHQKRGLGKALLIEGLRRLQRMGATTAFVGGQSPAANALYHSVMGSDFELYEPWIKKW